MTAGVGVPFGFRSTPTGSRLPLSQLDTNFTYLAQRTIFVSDTPYGAVGNPATANDTTAIQAALTAMENAGGGTVYLKPGVSYLVDSLVIGKNVTLKQYDKVPAVYHDQTTSPPTVFSYFYQMGGLVRSNSGGPAANFVTLRSGAGLEGVACMTEEVYKGFNGGAGTFGSPLPVNQSQFVANVPSNTWTGNGVQIAGAVASDRMWLCEVNNVMVVGFNKGVFATHANGGRLTNVHGDNEYGLQLQDTDDLPFVHFCQMWPLLSWASATAANRARGGYGFLFQKVTTGADGARVTDNYAYGYLRNFNLNFVYSVGFINNNSDGGDIAHAGRVGFYIENSCPNTILTSCTDTSNELGFYLNGDPVVSTIFNGCGAWANVGANSAGFKIDAGGFQILNCAVRDGTYGVRVNNAASRGMIEQCDFYGTNTAGDLPIKFDVGNALTIVLGNNYTNYPAGYDANIVSATLTQFGGTTITGTGYRFQADFSNATRASRYSFKSSTLNGATAIQALPNGASLSASFLASNAADPDNAALSAFGNDGGNNTIVRNTAVGTGVLGQVKLQTDGGTDRLVCNNTAAGGSVQINTKFYPPSDAAAPQLNAALYAGTGAPNNANGANGDLYFNAAGGALTTVYQRRAGAWVGIV